MKGGTLNLYLVDNCILRFIFVTTIYLGRRWSRQVIQLTTLYIESVTFGRDSLVNKSPQRAFDRDGSKYFVDQHRASVDIHGIQCLVFVHRLHHLARHRR